MRDLKEYIINHGEDKALYESMDVIINYFKENPAKFSFIENVLNNKSDKLTSEEVNSVAKQRTKAIEAINVLASMKYIKVQELKSLKGHKRFSSTDKLYQLDSIVKLSLSLQSKSEVQATEKPKQSESKGDSEKQFSSKPFNVISFFKWLIPILFAAGILYVGYLNYKKEPIVIEQPEIIPKKIVEKKEANKIPEKSINTEKESVKNHKDDTTNETKIKPKEQIKKYRSSSPLLSIGNSYVDKLTKISIGGSEINTSRQLTGVLMLPDKKIEFKNKTAGTSWDYDYDNKKYKIVLRNVLYIQGNFSVEIYEL